MWWWLHGSLVSTWLANLANLANFANLANCTVGVHTRFYKNIVHSAFLLAGFRADGQKLVVVRKLGGLSRSSYAPRCQGRKLRPDYVSSCN